MVIAKVSTVKSSCFSGCISRIFSHNSVVNPRTFSPENLFKEFCKIGISSSLTPSEDITRTSPKPKFPVPQLISVLLIIPNGKEEKPTSPFERPNYSVVDIEVGDDIIPEHFFELKFCNHDNIDLHPRPIGYKSEPLGEERYDQSNHVAPTNDTTENITPSNSPTTKQLISELMFRSSNWCSQNWKYVISVLIFIAFFLFMVTSKQLRHNKERVNIVLKEKTERTIKKEPECSETPQNIKEDIIKDDVIKQESEPELNI